MITSLVALVIRIVLLVAFTFAFVVLFEHGPEGFVDGASKELEQLTTFLQSVSGSS